MIRRPATTTTNPAAAAAAATAKAAPAAEAAPGPAYKPAPTGKPASSPAPLTVVDPEELAATQLAQFEEDEESAALVTHKSSNANLSTQQAASGDAFDGLAGEIGFGSFPIMKLQEGVFIVGNKELQECEGIMMGARKKWLVKARKGEEGEKIPLVYTYDGVKTADGTDITEITAKWLADGATPAGKKAIVSKYYELQLQIIDEEGKLGPGLHEQIVLCSLPPASISRGAGYLKSLQLKGLRPEQVLTKVCKGDRITRPDGKTFSPWDFKFVGKIEYEDEPVALLTADKAVVASQ